MPTPLTGVWLRSAQSNNPAATYTELPHVLHTVDKEHAVTDAADLNAWTYGAPAVPDVSGTGPYPGMEWIANTPGQVLDQTPEDHSVGYAGGSLRAELAVQEESHQAHSVDYGATLRANYYPAPEQDYTTRYMVARIEGNPAVEVNPTALMRGKNGLAVNNPPTADYPEGFRRGFDTQVIVDRKFQVTPWNGRSHDARPAYTNTAMVATDKPAPYGTTPAGPFNALARAFQRTWQTPEMRRVPSPVDESEIGTPPSYPPTADWV